MTRDKTSNLWRVVVPVISVALLAVVGTAFFLYRDAHPKAVAAEIANWEEEYSHPKNVGDASRSIGMLEYIETYYPYEDMKNYWSSDAVSALADQRQRTMQAIATGLREYSGEQYGPQPVEWRRWLESENLPDTE